MKDFPSKRDPKNRESTELWERMHQQNQNLEHLKQAMLNVLEDLQEEKKKIKASEVKLRTIVQSAVDGIIVIDAKGIIDSFNRAAEKIFGYQAHEVIGKNVKVLMPEPYRSQHDGYIRHYNETGERRIIGIGREVTGLRKDGTTFPMDLSVNMMEINGHYFFAGIVRDITERKKSDELLCRQKENLEKVNRELDSFVYTASHDLRAPLRGISSFAGFLEEDCKDQLDENGREYIQEIRKGAERLTHLIDDLLTLSRISRVHNPYENTDISNLIQSTIQRLQYDIDENQVELKVQEDIPHIDCDRIKMGAVFLNLINNAIKFSSKNKDHPPRIEVGYTGSSDVHQFHVKDNGIGIASEYHEQIFGVFKRLHTQDEFEGTGAGLSIVKRVIDDHNGRIWIESSPGSGAVFYFTIPKNLKSMKKEFDGIFDASI